jgi:hypothetical protein
MGEKRLPLSFVLIACLLASNALSGCGNNSNHSSQPVSFREWQAVVGDWLVDGRLSNTHSCAAAVVAEVRSHAVGGQRLTAALVAYAQARCRHTDVAAIRRGMSDREVADLAGLPDVSGARCWSYRHVSRTEAVRVCFKDGRAAQVKRVGA